MPVDVPLVVTSSLFRSRDLFSAETFPVSILATESCLERGVTSKKIFKNIHLFLSPIIIPIPLLNIRSVIFRSWPDCWRNTINRWRERSRV